MLWRTNRTKSAHHGIPTLGLDELSSCVPWNCTCCSHWTAHHQSKKPHPRHHRTLRRNMFWTTADLETKLIDFQHYYNGHRVHASLEGRPPEPTRDRSAPPLAFDSYRGRITLSRVIPDSNRCVIYQFAMDMAATRRCGCIHTDLILLASSNSQESVRLEIRFALLIRFRHAKRAFDR